MAKTKKTADAAASDDLLGGTPAADDLLGGGDAPAAKPAKSKAKPAAKAAKATPAGPKAAKADKPAAKAPKAPKAAKPAAAGVARGPRGTGKFFIDPDEFAALQKKVSTLKKPATSREIAEKFETDTWKARLAAAALVKSGKGSLAKIGSTLTFTPA